MSTKTWIVFAVLCLGLLGGLIAINQQNRVDVSEVNPSKLQTASKDNGKIADHIFGNAESKVVIIEYGDYQCPACADAAPTLKQLSEKYKDDIAFVFRNLPLTNIHPNARAAAAAAEAAGLQGKFWQMHDQLYSSQDSWAQLNSNERTDTFKSYAEGFGLDAKKWQEDLTSSRVAAKIDYDSAIAQQLGVTGTPAIYINGDLVDQYSKDGKIVGKEVEGSGPVWRNAADFEKLILIPAMKKAGIDYQD